MRVLILGGTEFLGRYLVHASLARNHQVTLFNRGITNTDLFPEVEKLRGDRNGNLQALKYHRWDVAIDTCGYVSWKVKATAELLSGAVRHYTYISSVSVYRDFSKLNLDESSAVELLSEGMVEDEDHDESYGARKVLCEAAAEQCLPGRVLSVRAGLIVGPYDGIDRFPYWVRRVAAGGNVLAPGHPDSFVQLIDVRDLADWTIRMAEARCVGIYNATGPKRRLTFIEMLEACKAASGSDAQFTWVDEKYLLAQGVQPFSELPFWLPTAECRGFFTVDSTRAFKAGLKCRPLVVTARDTLEWERNRDLAMEPPKRATALAEGQIGLTPDREAELLGAWRSKAH